MNQSNYSINEENFSIQKEIKKYTTHWKWFLISAFCFLFMGFIYLKRMSPIYNITSTILIKDNNEGRGVSELAAFEGLAGLSGGNNDIDDEVDIIKSKTLISKVVKKLNLNLNQYTKKGLKTIDLYGESPLKIDFKPNTFLLNSNGEGFGPFKIRILSKSAFLFIDLGLNENKEYTIGETTINHKYGVFQIDKSEYFERYFSEENTKKEIEISLNSIENKALSFQQSIAVRAKSKRSSLLDISLKSSNKKKAFDFINTLVNEYNKEAVNDKNLVSKNTIDFVDERLKKISKELDIVENNKTNFKKGKNLTDLESESKLFISQIGDSQKSILENETQLDLTNSMIQYLNKNESNFSLLPTNIGLENRGASESIIRFNNLVLERKKLLENSTELNPLVQDATSNLLGLKSSLMETLKSQKRNLVLIRKELNRQKTRVNSKITSIPSIEKDYRVIERQQQIKENLYLFLLKKKEEVSISMAVTTPPAKIIDRAYSSTYPVAPKKKIILLVSMLLGMLIPFFAIYAKDLLDNKVNDKADIEEIHQNVPVLAEIGRIRKGASDLLQVNDRSVLGESYRILRTNLNYLVKNKQRGNKAVRVFVTSTIKGEGKTFVSFNTVLALADSNKKILVVGADIRNPQLHRYLKNNKNTRGLSEFLYDSDLTFDDIVNTIEFNNHKIDYVTSGRIPPNPSELLMNGRLEELLNEVDDYYDYVIVDTAPTMLVTDTLIICESADITIYVVRAGYTEKQLLNYSKSLRKDGKIKNLAIVLNDIKQDQIGYGYGYGYGSTRKTFWQKFFKK